MGVLNRLKRFLPIKTLVVSYLNFGLLIWGFKCEKITKLQKKVVRISSLSKYNAHTEPLFKQVKLLKIIDIFKLQELKFYYTYKNNKLPHYLQSLPFHPNTETHNHATHIQHNIHEAKTNHTFAKNCVCFDIPKIVNVTPNSILDKIHNHSLQGFFWIYKGTYFTILSGTLFYGGLLFMQYANLIFHNIPSHPISDLSLYI